MAANGVPALTTLGGSEFQDIATAGPFWRRAPNDGTAASQIVSPGPRALTSLRPILLLLIAHPG